MSGSGFKRTLLLWFIALVITLASVVYQRLTGPTYPLKGSVDFGGQVVDFDLPRTHSVSADAQLAVMAPAAEIAGEFRWRRYRSHDDWQSRAMARAGDTLLAAVPRQPAAGKVMYQVILTTGPGESISLTEQPVIIRFKGDVPVAVLLPHVVFMFLGMLLATRAGLEALSGVGRTYGLTVWTTVLLSLGGLIFGPIVQKYAFDAFWTGWPLGTDLTDSKTAFALLFWAVALWRGRDRRHLRLWALIAAIVTLAIFLIPHSVYGSELDYTAME